MQRLRKLTQMRKKRILDLLGKKVCRYWTLRIDRDVGFVVVVGGIVGFVVVERKMIFHI